MKARIIQLVPYVLVGGIIYIQPHVPRANDFKLPCAVRESVDHHETVYLGDDTYVETDRHVDRAEFEYEITRATSEALREQRNLDEFIRAVEGDDD